MMATIKYQLTKNLQTTSGTLLRFESGLSWVTTGSTSEKFSELGEGETVQN
jgi:hypothetical protein